MISIDRKKINQAIDFILTYEFSGGRKAKSTEEDVWEASSSRSPLPVAEGGYLGKILMDRRLLTREQFDQAYGKLRDFRFIGRWKSLGGLLAEMGFVDPREYLRALAEHFQLPAVSLRGFTPSSSLQKMVGEGYAQKNRIVVLGGEGETIRVALADPDPLVMDELGKMAGPRKKLRFALADPVEVEDCLQRVRDPFGTNFYR
jgi:hypothetical protein